MSYINVDVHAITQLAIYLDEYQGELSRTLQAINEKFDELQRKGYWNDDRYQEFKSSHLSKLNDDMQYIFNELDNELKPFLADYYQRLKNYQDL